MSATLYGSLVPKFGTTNETSLGIYVSRLRRTDDTDEKLLTDGDGDIMHAAYSGSHGTLEGDFKVVNTGYPAAALVASTLTLTDAEFAGTYIVKTVSNEKTEADWMTGSFTLRQFAGISVP
jgi:hypothetical protein